MLRPAVQGGESVLASRRPMSWDGLHHHAYLGNRSLFLISARTAREYALPTLDRLFQLNSLYSVPPERRSGRSDLVGSFADRIQIQIV